MHTQKYLTRGREQNKCLMKGPVTKIWPKLRNKHRMVRHSGTRTRPKGQVWLESVRARVVENSQEPGHQRSVTSARAQ